MGPRKLLYATQNALCTATCLKLINTGDGFLARTNSTDKLVTFKTPSFISNWHNIIVKTGFGHVGFVP
jgi:hypothetical protein